MTFNVTATSVGDKNTNIVFTYNRSANGAKERIIIKNCDIEILYNGEKQKTINRLEFALNEYKTETKDFTGDNATQYQCKISIGKKVEQNDTVKVVFKKKTGNVIGEGAESAKIDTLTVSLIDNDKDAGGKDKYYNELVENEKEYQPLFPKENPKPETPATPTTGGEETGETAIFSEEKEITWGDFVIIEASKFDGETPKTISIYFDCLDKADEKGDKYVAMKIAANYKDASLGDGTVTGGNLKADDKGALDGLGNPGETGKVVSYTPTADEWNDKITKTGFYVNGYGVVIKKVTLK